MALPIKGESGIFYVHDGTMYRPVACLTSNSFNPTYAVIESNTKCNPGVTIKRKGAFNYTVQGDGEYIDTTSVGGDTAKASHDFLFGLMTTEESVNWKYDTGAPDVIYYGEGIITDLPLTQDSGDAISTFSITIEGSGEVTKTDPLA